VPSSTAVLPDTAPAGGAAQAAPHARGRPPYPPELLAWLQGPLDLGPSSVAVDLGAGTGRFTRLLLQTGAEVIAVEPVDALRNQLANRLLGARALAGTAQGLPLESGSVDAVLCAQSFHHFADEAALDEIHRVLAPGGRLGLVWHERDESVDWVAAFAEIIAPYEIEAPHFRGGRWRAPLADHPGFGPLHLKSVPHRHVGPPREVLLDRVLSISFIAALPPSQRDEVADAIAHLMASHPSLRGADTVAFPYCTRAFHCTARAIP
jgi:SAM-dependent methyltransferase